MSRAHLFGVCHSVGTSRSQLAMQSDFEAFSASRLDIATQRRALSANIGVLPFFLDLRNLFTTVGRNIPRGENLSCSKSKSCRYYITARKLSSAPR
jgi:hypothetical protein